VLNVAWRVCATALAHPGNIQPAPRPPPTVATRPYMRYFPKSNAKSEVDSWYVRSPRSYSFSEPGEATVNFAGMRLAQPPAASPANHRTQWKYGCRCLVIQSWSYHIPVGDDWGYDSILLFLLPYLYASVRFISSKCGRYPCTLGWIWMILIYCDRSFD
jgi:hypothetical protein